MPISYVCYIHMYTYTVYLRYTYTDICYTCISYLGHSMYTCMTQIYVYTYNTNTRYMYIYITHIHVIHVYHTWAIASTWSTPGMMGLSGKWPVNCISYICVRIPVSDIYDGYVFVYVRIRCIRTIGLPGKWQVKCNTV